METIDSNAVELVGTLVRKGEPGHTRAGLLAYNLTVATQRAHIGAADDAAREDWHHVCCYGSLAERVATLPEGSRVRVRGVLQNRITQSHPHRRLTAVYAQRIDLA